MKKYVILGWASLALLFVGTFVGIWADSETVWGMWGLLWIPPVFFWIIVVAKWVNGESLHDLYKYDESAGADHDR